MYKIFTGFLIVDNSDNALQWAKWSGQPKVSINLPVFANICHEFMTEEAVQDVQSSTLVARWPDFENLQNA